MMDAGVQKKKYIIDPPHLNFMRGKKEKKNPEEVPPAIRY